MRIIGQKLIERQILGSLYKESLMSRPRWEQTASRVETFFVTGGIQTNARQSLGGHILENVQALVRDGTRLSNPVIV